MAAPRVGRSGVGNRPIPLHMHNPCQDFSKAVALHPSDNFSL
ncbi:hypothetical protein HMPREF0004_4433 [Achromobacter piechaudii ATCC 43553]|uniref:Uncharacterized protein n=1 Tax=Achromobacter piechaudii ATCC 43553 TaxID=742159 RepID=D4XG56_9BURK|nr:hypothetical protein HMPREF0004_4433 [Achromobacter piechaudii ATCC 43553]